LGKQVCPASALKVDVSHRAHYFPGCADRGGSDHLDQLPQVSFWKVGLELFVSSGPGILRTLRTKQKRIFLDLKFHDIPNTVAGACRSATRHGVDLLTIHATSGREALMAGTAVQSEAAQVGYPPPKLIARC